MRFAQLRRWVLNAAWIWATAAGTALAAEPGRWYAGITFGAANARFGDDIVQVAGATASTVSRDARDPGVKILLGLQINRHLALEGGYVRLGEFRATRDVAAPSVGSFNADLRLHGLVFDAVGTLPLGRNFSALGRAGGFFSEAKTFRAASGTLPGGAASGSTIHDELTLRYGLGLQYRLSERAALRAEWERFPGVGNPATTGEADVDLYSIGIVLRF
jgi:hypothetical protein